MGIEVLIFEKSTRSRIITFSGVCMIESSTQLENGSNVRKQLNTKSPKVGIHFGRDYFSQAKAMRSFRRTADYNAGRQIHLFAVRVNLNSNCAQPAYCAHLR